MLTAFVQCPPLLFKIFKEDGCLAYYIDGQKESQNWMKFVNCAQNSEEQNLELVQDGDQLFYESCRDILHGEQLLVWYGNCYHMFMGIPTGIKALPKKENNNESGQGEILILKFSYSVTRQLPYSVWGEFETIHIQKTKTITLVSFYLTIQAFFFQRCRFEFVRRVTVITLR